MKKSLVFSIALILSIFAVKSFYNARCMDAGYDYSILTVSGVYCKIDGTLIAPYKLLREIHEKELYYIKKGST